MPFAWNLPKTQCVVYKLIDGKFAGTVLSDSDITGISCNFYNWKTRNYDGADVRTKHNDLTFDLNQSYYWPPNVCDTDATQTLVRIRKSVPSIFMINDSGYKRYQPPQTRDTSNKISEKGKLTNITLTGAYEILDGQIYTVNCDYNADGSLVLDNEDVPLVQRMEQGERTAFQSTPHYSAKSSAQIINDRERIHLYDRIPQYSNNYGTEYRTVSNPKLPPFKDEDGNIPQQQRSLFSSAGMLFILDRDLGINAYNRWGEMAETCCGKEGVH